jgi:hypothetical protein
MVREVRLVALLWFTALLAAAGPVAAEQAAGLGPLGGSRYHAFAPFLGKLGIRHSEPAIVRDGATCSAVAVATDWVLTAAHCVHRRTSAPPWTPGHFAGRHALETMIFMPTPIGRGAIYRIVEVVTSDRFPDPGAATEDWAFLRLDRPMPLDPRTLPVVAPSAGALGEIRVAGFTRQPAPGGGVDWQSVNTPLVSHEPCRLGEYRDESRGPMPELLALDCIPPINAGLSGGPIVAFDGAGRGRIVAIQMGAGYQAESGVRVAVAVRSEQFLPAYRRIVGRR